MPTVGNKKFAYTKKGMAAAKKEADKKGTKVNNKSKYLKKKVQKKCNALKIEYMVLMQYYLQVLLQYYLNW